jgi:RND family efflux transporter MFP subunit
MTNRTLILVLVAGAIGLTAGVLGFATVRALLRVAEIGRVAPKGAEAAGELWTCGMHPDYLQDRPGLCPICHMDLTPVRVDAGGGAPAAAPEPGAPRRIVYWWDPMMSPPYISEQPGKSPMGMDLVPVYEDELSAGSTVIIDPVVVQNMGVRLAPVGVGALRRTIRAVGSIEEAQPGIRDINLRVSGWISRLYADTEGQRVEAGDPLFDLYSPELRVAVSELIAARQSLERAVSAEEPARRSARMLYDSAEQKLELFGLPRDQVDELARLEHAPETVTFRSPIAGEVVEKPVVEGAAVMAGDRALRIVDHSTLWLDARVFEKDLPFVAIGQKAEAAVDSRPGEVVEGEVVFIHPHVDAMTRTAAARLSLPNADMKLRPGMYATVRIAAQLADRAVLVPREAVIDTGARQVAFVAEGAGRFQPRQVVLGHAAEDGMVQVLEGLSPGESVVVSGQFLLDSESRLRESIRKFLDERRGGTAEPPPPDHQHGAGTAPQPPIPEADAVLSEYLTLSAILGEPQVTDAPVDAGALVAAAHALHGAVAGSEGEAIAVRLAAAAEALRGQALDRQRELFKALSDEVIALAQRHPPSAAVAGPLFIMHCPMAPGSWIQKSETVNNPYYATSMKRCGEVRRTITTGAAP